MNIGPPIDWAATGSMLSGWATLFGALAVVYAAKVGSNRFSEWKRQKIEERRMVFAEELLTSLYRFERTMAFVRGPFHSAIDLERANERLREQIPDFDAQAEDLKSRQRTAQVIFNRMENERPVIETISQVLPMTKALFPQLGPHLESLWRQVHVVRVSAQSYARAGQLPEEREERLGRDIWALENEDDRVYVEIQRAKLAIEAVLLPVIHESFVS